jgi:hypothetical protein
MHIPGFRNKELIFFFLRVIVVAIGLSYVFLTHVYANALPVDGPITFGFPFPTCTITSGFGTPSTITCSRMGQVADVLSAFIAATFIMFVFRQIGGRREPPKATFPSSS